MPFTTDVLTVETDMWDFDDSLSDAARQLTELYNEDPMAYAMLMAKYQEDGRDFIERDGVVYERSAESLALQKLFDAKNGKAFDALVAEYDKQGHSFVLSQGVVHEVFPKRRKTSVQAQALQALVDAEDMDEYHRQREAYAAKGLDFVLTNGTVYQKLSKYDSQSPLAIKLQGLYDKAHQNGIELFTDSEIDSLNDLGWETANPETDPIDTWTLCKIEDSPLYQRLLPSMGAEGAKAQVIASRQTFQTDVIDRVVQRKQELMEEYEAQKDKYEATGRIFSIKHGKVYERVPDLNKGPCTIRFQVKKGVMNWYFITPMKDQSTQPFRDRVFETAALAHQFVDNGCEAYYRGTNHLHLLLMHTDLREYDWNHNHYRINQGYVTPREVFQHVMAFSKMVTDKGYRGSEFVNEERAQQIICRFTLDWAEYSHDVRYAMFLEFASVFDSPKLDPVFDAEYGQRIEEGKAFRDNLLKQFAEEETPKYTPKELELLLDDFIRNDKDGANVALGILHLFDQEATLTSLREKVAEVCEVYRAAYEEAHPDYNYAEDSVEEFEPHAERVFETSDASPRTLSPRQQYLKDKKEQMDAIDKLEMAVLSPRLVRACRSISEHHLGKLEPQHFRYAFMLYNMLRIKQLDLDSGDYSAEQIETISVTIDGEDRQVRLSDMKAMLAKVASLQVGSTEDEMSDELLSQLIQWLAKPPPMIKEWIAHTSVHGSRGLGSGIAMVRGPGIEASSDVSFWMAPTDGNRSAVFSGKDAAAIDAVFNRAGGGAVVPVVIIEQGVLDSLKLEIGSHVKKLTSTLLATSGSSPDKPKLIARINLMGDLLKMIKELSNKQSVEILEGISERIEEMQAKHAGWDTPITGFGQNVAGDMCTKVCSEASGCLSEYQAEQLRSQLD